MAAPQYGQQPHGQGQQPYVQQPREGIAITTLHSPLAVVYFFLKPRIYLNGYEVPGRGWGRSALPAAPGQYHVHVHTPYWIPSRLGPADLTVEVNPGQLVELEYKAPLFTLSPGALGPPPQRYNGLGVTIAIIVAAILVVLFVPVVMWLAT